ncbi:MAG: hypothetical protein QXP70_04085 [Methanomassiliicoccales archaeon]
MKTEYLPLHISPSGGVSVDGTEAYEIPWHTSWYLPPLRARQRCSIMEIRVPNCGLVFTFL